MDCIKSVGYFWKYQQVDSIKLSNPWTSNVFTFVMCLSAKFVVFSVQVFCLFAKAYSSVIHYFWYYRWMSSLNFCLRLLIVSVQKYSEFECLTVNSATLLNLFISSNSLCVCDLGFSTYKTMLSMNINNFNAFPI